MSEGNDPLFVVMFTLVRDCNNSIINSYYLFPPPLKQVHQDIAEILLKVALNTISFTL
jgi:uncharacterized membrane protein YadS